MPSFYIYLIERDNSLIYEEITKIKKNMKIIVEEVKKKPDFNIIETTPYAGVKKVKVSVEIEKGKIIDFPYILYVNDLSNTISRDQENEFVYENLTSHSKKELDEWIKKLNS